MVDAKPFDLELSSGMVPANGAIHDMSLRLTVDSALTIVDASQRPTRCRTRPHAPRSLPTTAMH